MLTVVSMIAALAAAAAAQTYNIDGSALGRTFDGVGGLSGGGATSRLLPSYDSDKQGEILDFLFKPNFGASLHIAKVEIGGDAQSTDGTESSHMHWEEDLNCDRGYEWMILEGAKQRNPDIKTYGLSWAWPRWVGGGGSTPWDDVQKSSNYTMNWLHCARGKGIEIDYIGSWNERSYSDDYLVSLRQQMDAAGFTNTTIVAPDAGWNIAGDIMNNASVAKAVGVIGAHYPGMHSSSQAQQTGKPLWASEDDSTLNSNIGAACWGRIVNRNYVEGQMTATINWNLLASYMPGLNWYSTSFMTADQPWSGNYIVESEIWVAGHTGQFARPGWKYLLVDSSSLETGDSESARARGTARVALDGSSAASGSGSGMLLGGGSYVTLVDPESKDFSIVIEKFHADRSRCVRPGLPEYNTTAETATFVLDGLVQGQTQTLAVWKTHLAYDGAKNVEFSRQPDITVTAAKPQFAVQIDVDDIISISTLTSGPAKGSYPTPPGRTPFPVPYDDDFESCPMHGEGSYFYDQAGSFECLAAPGGRSGIAMRQQVPALPICWGGDVLPISQIGSDTFTDASQTVDFFIEEGANDNATAVLAARTVGQVHARGVFVSIALDGSYGVYYSVEDMKQPSPKPAFSGKLPATVSRGEWHTLALQVANETASAQLDGKSLFSGASIHDCQCPFGFAAVAVGAWEPVWYDNYKLISATDNGAVCAHPAAGQNVQVRGCSADEAMGERWTVVESTGQLQLQYDSSLCMGVSGTDPNSHFPNLAVVKCDASDATQQFIFDLTDKSTYIQLKSNGTLCVDSTGGGSGPGTNIEAYTCNGGGNQMWVVDELGRIVNGGFTSPKRCAGPCDDLPWKSSPGLPMSEQHAEYARIGRYKRRLSPGARRELDLMLSEQEYA